MILALEWASATRACRDVISDYELAEVAVMFSLRIRYRLQILLVCMVSLGSDVFQLTLLAK